MVIITDKNLKIVSINIAVERLLRTSIHQVQGQPVSDVLTLKDERGVRILFDDLPVKQALIDKATHIVEGYSLETKIEAIAKPVTIQIRPLTNPSGEISQIVFVLTDPLLKVGFNTHPNIADAIKKRDLLLAKLTDSTLLPESSARQLITLITHLEEDILTVQEMEDHPLQEVIGFVDLVTLVKESVAGKSFLYLSIGNVPEVKFEDEDNSEAAFLDLDMDKSGLLNTSKYTAAIDSYLLKIILEKLFDFSVFASGNAAKPQVYISLIPDNVKIEINFPQSSLTQKDLSSFFIKNYPGIKLASLQNSSGLEGYIAGRVSRAVGLPLESTINTYKKIVTITLIIQKQVKIHTDNAPSQI